jgi:hypothetical protein
MTRQAIILVAGCGAAWILAAIPARLLAGDQAAVYAGVACALCLVPALATLLWAGLAFRGSPESQLAAVLGGTGLRLFVVLAATWLVSTLDDFQEGPGFLWWVLAFYLLTLALELTVLLASRQRPVAGAAPVGAGTESAAGNTRAC